MRECKQSWFFGCRFQLARNVVCFEVNTHTHTQRDDTKADERECVKERVQ